MDNSWEHFEPSPIEALHYEIMDNFHRLRVAKGDSISVLIDGSELAEIIAISKKEIYNKYKNLQLDQPIEKARLS